MKCGIYSITNRVNGHKYVGQSVRLEYRMMGHLKLLRKGIHSNGHLQSAFTKYGESKFVFKVLEYCSKDELTNREQYWMDKLSPEYNVYPAAGSPLGYRQSRETRERISKAIKGKRNTKLSEYFATHKVKVSSETKRKISKAKKGKKNPKLAQYLKGKVLPWLKPKGRK